MASNWSKSSIRGMVTTLAMGDHILVNDGEMTVEVVDIRGRWVRLAFATSNDIKLTAIKGAHKTNCTNASCEVCKYITNKQSQKEN